MIKEPQRAHREVGGGFTPPAKLREKRVREV
jgi:hypothetical protein